MYTVYINNNVMNVHHPNNRLGCCFAFFAWVPVVSWSLGSLGAMDMVAEEQTTERVEKHEHSFKLPFGVATLDSIQQRAYINEEGCPEWLWSRAHAFLGIASEPGKLLRVNLDGIQNAMQSLQVPAGELHYRKAQKPADGEQPQQPQGQDGQQPQGQDEANKKETWQDHTFESRGLLVILLWVMKNRALKAAAKVKSLTLLLELAARALSIADVQRPFMGMVTLPNGNLACKELYFSEQGICKGWQELLAKCPPAIQLWKKLGQRCWLNTCISSGLETATSRDIWVFMSYMFCHQKQKTGGQNVFKCLGQGLLTEFVCRTGLLLKEVAISISEEALKSLPQLKTKHGHARRVADPVNKILLLWKLRREKVERRRVARTHDELGGDTSRMLVYEAYLDCLLHKKALENEFSSSSQISVSWDPSTYGGKEILMAIAFDPHTRKAAYLMAQHMVSTMVSELDPDLIPLAKARKLTRVEGFKEIKALSCALQSIGLSLASFIVPPGLTLRPLKPTEYRLEGAGGRFFIVDEHSQQTVPEIPEHVDIGALPCLVSISDQGPNIIGAVNYLQYHAENALLFHAQFDPYHRAWNDLKLAMKKTKPNAWRVVLELTLVCNLNYGPYGSSAWFWKKKARLADFLATQTAFGAAWQKYAPKICQERRIREPTDPIESQDLFDQLRDLETFNQKGPLIKLMRWFSWFESMLFYSGELQATKMVLEHAMGVPDEGSDKEVDVGPPATHQDDRQELNELKRRKGTWKLAPELISDRTLALKDIILSVGKASWQTFAARARDLVSPDHVLEFNISCSSQAYWKHELVEMLHTSLLDRRHLQHLEPQYQTHPQALEWQVDLLDRLLEQRTESLCAFHTLPPMAFCHALSPSLEVSLAAHKLANKQWKILLEAEGADNEGADVQPLACMHWRKSPFVRLIFLAFEQDALRRRAFTTGSAAVRLMKVVAQNLGDSRVIENVHQFGRDLFRGSKANSFSNTTIMSNCLRSKVLEGRRVECVNAETVEKVMGDQWQQKWKGNVTSSLRSYGKKMPKSIQLLMKPQSKDHSWATPGPHSLFQSCAAGEWLFTFWQEKTARFAGCTVNAAWLTCLARPGCILAQRSTGILVKVMAAAEFGLLAVTLHVHSNGGQRIYQCAPIKGIIMWHHIVDLDDWLEVQCQPVLANVVKGPIGWLKCGGPLFLAASPLVAGHTLSHKQMRQLLEQVIGQKVNKNMAKAALHLALIEAVVPEEYMDVAKKFIEEKKNQEDGYDTDLSEVLSELGKEADNQNDLREFKDKKKIRLKKLIAKSKDEPIQGRPKRKAKAKPKGKAKAKATAKVKPRGLLKSLINMAKKSKAREDREMKEAEAMEVPEEEENKDADEEMAPDKSPAVPNQGPAEPVEPDVPGSSAASSSKAPPPVRAARRKSPEELLSALSPPGCKFGVSFQDHRFTSGWRQEHKELPSPYDKKTFSRTFVERRTWQEALALVHQHNWEKWEKLQDTYPVGGQRVQVPGELPDDIVEQLEDTIKSLPKVVRYA